MLKPFLKSFETSRGAGDNGQTARRFLQPGTIIDQYIIERPLAGGGFGAVYLARQLDDQVQVAIKEYMPRRLACRHGQGEVAPLSEEARPQFFRGRQLFLEEAKVLATLRHHNIVEVLNFFSVNSTVYLVMTFEYGKSLGQILRKEEKQGLSEQTIIKVFWALLDGLRMVHDRELLHLDIKPQNILIRPGWDPLLLDFGASQPFSYSERPRFGKVLSDGFSPVEQYRQEGNLGPWSDLYSVGATMRMCLDGTFPPPAPTRATHDTLVPAAEALKHRYTAGLLRAIDWAMAVEPEQRPQTVSEFLDVFGRAAPRSGGPIEPAGVPGRR